jgi:hypothetical protein
MISLHFFLDNFVWFSIFFQCQFADFYKKTASDGGNALIDWNSGGAVFPQPKVIKVTLSSEIKYIKMTVAGRVKGSVQ